MKNIKISKRLQTVASFVQDNAHVIDVGCDHALLSIYLYYNKKNIKIIASDINPNPLSIAKDNLLKHNLLNEIELILQDGIENIPSLVDTIIIAGMGGDMIINILSDQSKLTNINNIIVAPNCDTPKVRKQICKQGFYLDNESLVYEKSKYYIVSSFKKGKMKRINYLFGLLEKNELVIKYCYQIIRINNQILKDLPKKYILKRIRLRYQNIIINNYIKR